MSTCFWDGWGLEGLISIEALKALWQPLGADSMIPPGESWKGAEFREQLTRKDET
jgi:hypothetical protein